MKTYVLIVLVIGLIAYAGAMNFVERRSAMEARADEYETGCNVGAIIALRTIGETSGIKASYAQVEAIVERCSQEADKVRKESLF